MLHVSELRVMINMLLCRTTYYCGQSLVMDSAVSELHRKTTQSEIVAFLNVSDNFR